MRRTGSSSEMGGSRHATADDFQKLFATEMGAFYRLAFLMIADSAKAEECLIVAMKECIHGISIAEGWAETWARRVVVRNAIRMAAEFKKQSLDEVSNEAPHSTCSPTPRQAERFAEFAGILALRDFERIVFVLCVLERYSIRDCALLLGRSQQDVNAAKIRAIEQLADYEIAASPQSTIHTCAEHHAQTINEPGEVNDACGTLLN